MNVQDKNTSRGQGPAGPGPAPRAGVARTVTLCGSMRFYPLMLAVAAELTVREVVVLAPFLAVAPAAQDGSRAEVKTRLDRLHRVKIDRSDEVIVVSDESGYHGDSTRAEIDYARTLGLPITYRRITDHQAAATVADLAGTTTCTAAGGPHYAGHPGCRDDLLGALRELDALVTDGGCGRDPDRACRAHELLARVGGLARGRCTQDGGA